MCGKRVDTVKHYLRECKVRRIIDNKQNVARVMNDRGDRKVIEWMRGVEKRKSERKKPS